MSSNSNTVRQLVGEIQHIATDLREVVFSAPSQLLWDSVGSAISTEQIAELIEKIEGNVQNVQQYCNGEYREATDTLMTIMWTGLQTKNYHAIIEATKQLVNIKIDFNKEPFSLKHENL